MPRIFFSVITMVISAIMLSSCNDKQPKDLFEEQQSGVCMVLNSYYYKIVLPTGATWYCSGIDSDGDLEDLTFDEDEAKQNRSMSIGTAFFIDSEGTLMTNRHVVNPFIEEDVIRNGTSKIISQIKEFLQYYQFQNAEKYEKLELQKQDCYYIDMWGTYTLDRVRYYQIKEEQKELASEYYETQSAIDIIDNIAASSIKVIPIMEIGIAYNDTFVTGEDDFLRDNPCVITKVSDDDEIDLALIQLKNKRTPAEKYVFKIKGRDIITKSFGEEIASWFSSENDENIDVDKELIMIGFNAGMILGNTRQGIQAQMTTGKVSQKPDGTKILYSIPTLTGSSGSPVIDTDGYVRAVNFAKLRGTDSFNFGIPENKILNFLNQ